MSKLVTFQKICANEIHAVYSDSKKLLPLIEANVKQTYLNLKLLLLANRFGISFPVPTRGLVVALHCILGVTVLIQAQTLTKYTFSFQSFSISTAVCRTITDICTLWYLILGGSTSKCTSNKASLHMSP